MNEDFAKQAYEEHRQLFLHYSSLVFRARVAMATVIVAVFGVLAGFPSGDPPDGVLFGLPAGAVLPYLAALLVPVLFVMETAYLARLVEVAEAAGRIERNFDSRLYFVGYARRQPWRLYLLYILATVALLAAFVANTWAILHIGGLVLLTLIPAALLLMVILQVPRHPPRES